MSTMRRFKGTDLGLGIVAVAVNVLLVAGVIMVTGGGPTSATAPSPTVRPSVTTPGTPTSTAPAPTSSAAAAVPELATLATTTRPVTLAVLGDGTGDEEGEWVTALGGLLGRNHHVTVHNLDTSDPTRYADELTYGSTGPAFTIWNGSRRGATADYAVTRLSFLVPARPDAVLLSYGRQDTAGTIGEHLETTLRAVRGRWPGATVSVILQAPERDDVSKAVRDAAQHWATKRSLSTIDVAAALRRAGNPNQFVSVVDPPSVNQLGGRFWALAVYRALGGTAPDPVIPPPAPRSSSVPVPPAPPVPADPDPHDRAHPNGDPAPPPLHASGPRPAAPDGDTDAHRDHPDDGTDLHPHHGHLDDDRPHHVDDHDLAADDRALRGPRPVKILLLTHYYEPEVGAPQQRWSALVERFVRAGHQVSVIAPAPHYPAGVLLPEHAGQRPGSIHAGRHGETVHRAAFRSYGTKVGSRFTDQAVAAASAVRLVSGRFRRHRPDVVVATVPSLPMLAAGAAVSRSLGVPLVVEMRDAWPDLLDVADEWDLTTPDGVPAPKGERGAAGEVLVTRPAMRPSTPGARLGAGVRRGGTRLLHGVATSLQRGSDAVVTTTESFAETLRDRGVEPVHVVRNGAHPIEGWPGSPARRSPSEPLRLLYAGTLGRAQGLTTVVKAVSLATRAGTLVEVRVLGAGAEEHLVRELSGRLGTPVDVRGPVPRAELADHYAWADSVIVALRPWRGLSLTVPSKLYEAMSLGLHVSASVSGEAARIVQQTQAGDVCPPGDEKALAALWAELADDRSRVEIGPAAAAWVREHASDDRLAEDYLAVLESVVRP